MEIKNHLIKNNKIYIFILLWFCLEIENLFKKYVSQAGHLLFYIQSTVMGMFRIKKDTLELQRLIIFLKLKTMVEQRNKKLTFLYLY